MSADSVPHAASPDHGLRKTLPAYAYLDPEIFARESREIFRRSWLFACHGEKLRAPFAYRVTELAGESLILLRGEDGRLRAFYNVCAHRASRLLAGEGSAKRITCPLPRLELRQPGPPARRPQRPPGQRLRHHRLWPQGLRRRGAARPGLRQPGPRGDALA